MPDIPHSIIKQSPAEIKLEHNICVGFLVSYLISSPLTCCLHRLDCTTENFTRTEAMDLPLLVITNYKIQYCSHSLGPNLVFLFGKKWKIGVLIKFVDSEDSIFWKLKKWCFKIYWKFLHVKTGEWRRTENVKFKCEDCFLKWGGPYNKLGWLHSYS